MEQSANPIAGLRTNTRTIQAVTKDTPFQAYIGSLTAAAPSDSVFVRWAQIDLLTYLCIKLQKLISPPQGSWIY